MGKLSVSEPLSGSLSSLFCQNVAPGASECGDPGNTTSDSEFLVVYWGCPWRKLDRIEAEERWVSVLRLLRPKVRGPVVT